MKVLVILAVAGVCVALPHRFLSDTPEVVAEKQRFFQLYNAAAAAAAAAPDDYELPRQASTSSYYSVAQQSPQWRGPLASSVPAGVHGNFAPVQETPEVAAARREFEQAYQQQLRATSSPSSHNQHHNQHSHHSNSFFSEPRYVDGERPWTGPVAATIPAGLPGSVSQVPNTPEVEAAIADFNQAYNAALSNTVGTRRHQSSSYGQSSYGSSGHFNRPTSGSFHESSFSGSYPATSYVSPQQTQPKWGGPFAASIPAGLPGSVTQVQDTAEVAAAKAQFQRAFQKELVYRG